MTQPKPWHCTGACPAPTALRVLLANAGVLAPHTGQPFSEAMLFGIAGGIGAGVFTFFYEKENFASFFIAGRHNWQDTTGYLKQALANLAIKPILTETAGAKAGEKALRAALAAHGTCIAWVDMAHLPHRALPAQWSGGGYHVISVYQIDDHAGTALIGDLTTVPIPISLADLATARARIKKDKHRLLSIQQSPSPMNLADLVRTGLRQCYRGLEEQRMKNFTLDAFRVWGERLHGSKDKESWERLFTPGPRLWQGLFSIYDFIEYHGTGGGLCRPLFADFLTEAADALGDRSLHSLAERYRELGSEWSALANAAFPEEVPAFREARKLTVRKAKLTRSNGDVDEIRGIFKRLHELQYKSPFPLSDADSANLRARLQQRVLALYDKEKAAHAAIGAAIV
jgi:hypothetical protein